MDVCRVFDPEPAGFPFCCSRLPDSFSACLLRSATQARAVNARGPMHYLLFYDVVPDYVIRRQPFRAAHLDYARPFIERGELLLGGALAEPVDGAVLLFRGQTPDVARAFAATDPYVQQGLVTRWRVRPWTTVVGPAAEVSLP